MKCLFILLLVPYLWSCNRDSKTEKYHQTRDKVTSVKDKVVEIPMDEVLVGSIARLSISKDYLIVADHNSLDKLIHLFDSKYFKYLSSTGSRGQGPDEITVLGRVVVNEGDRSLLVSDHGKNVIYSFSIDSLQASASYMPWVKLKMKKQQFPSVYDYINDTLSIGLFIEPIGNSNFKPYVSKWNMVTGEVKYMDYEHPEIKEKRISYGLSLEKELYAESHSFYDLVTICDLNGRLKYNIYGPSWGKQSRTKIHHFGNIFFCGDKILAAYSGGNNSTDEYYPTKFIVFDLDGNYLSTLDVGYRIANSIYDKERNRVIMSFNDSIQFGYLDLDGLV